MEQPWEGKVTLRREACVEGCFACADICPTRALHVNDDGELVLADYYCIKCGACMQICPVKPIIEMEELGLAERGEGGELFLRGDTAIEGRLPVNTDGGLLSHAQAGSGGGIFGIIEATRQLRGTEGARQVEKHDVALVHNEGGILSSNCTMLLGREKR